MEPAAVQALGRYWIPVNRFTKVSLQWSVHLVRTDEWIGRHKQPPPRLDRKPLTKLRAATKIPKQTRNLRCFALDQSEHSISEPPSSYWSKKWCAPKFQSKLVICGVLLWIFRAHHFWTNRKEGECWRHDQSKSWIPKFGPMKMCC